MTAMPLEITLLGWSVVLLLVQVMLQAQLATMKLGLNYNASPRDSDRKPSGLAAPRAARALANLLETYPAFIALALALTLTGKTGGYGALGAEIWLAARVIYVPVYLAGIPFLRTLLWLASIVGLVMMLIRLLA